MLMIIVTIESDYIPRLEKIQYCRWVIEMKKPDSIKLSGSHILMRVLIPISQLFIKINIF